MSRDYIVSNGTNAKQVQRYVVVQGGINVEIGRSLVVDGGINHEYFPAVGDSTDPRIVMTNTAAAPYDSVADPEDASARFQLLQTGNLAQYDDFPNVALKQEAILNPPLDGTVGDDGKYLCRMTGVGLTGTLNTWIDINSIVSEQEWSLDNTVVSLSSLVGTFSVAADDGGGSPVAATQVDKTLNFQSDVLSSDGEFIGWSTNQWDLEELSNVVDVDCILNLFNNGTASGLADTSGNFFEDWYTNAPVVPDPENYTVQVDVISGTSPTGDSLATPLALDTSRQWVLPATASEDFSCELDVTVSRGTANVVKRVTMHSQRGDLPTTNVWSATPAWAISDNTVDQAEARAIVRVETNGTVVGDTLHSGEQHNEDYNSDAPTATDGINYEARLTVVSGAQPAFGGPTVGVFHLCDIQLIWEIIENDPPPPTIRETSAVWDLEIRRVGEAGTTKRITLSALLEDGGGP